jgi:hypothetical protein
LVLVTICIHPLMYVKSCQEQFFYLWHPEQQAAKGWRDADNRADKEGNGAENGLKSHVKATRKS